MPALFLHCLYSCQVQGLTQQHAYTLASHKLYYTTCMIQLVWYNFCALQGCERDVVSWYVHFL